MGGGGVATAADPLGRGGAVAEVLIPGLLAAQAGGQSRFEVDAATLGDALRALPVADLLFDERGDLRALVNPFVDKQLARDLATPVGAGTQVRIVAAIAGG
jgi:molybdopterin converting factor small subunit